MSRHKPKTGKVMKKMILFTAALLLIVTTVKANDHNHADHKDRVTKRYHNTQPIVFIEGGIKFLVYPEGSIDYKVLNRRGRSHYGNWNTRRYNTPGTYTQRVRAHHNNFIRYDYYGRLKKVGPNYISYDRYNRVRRIGTISIRYNRRGLVYQIGGLRIYYNRYDRIRETEGNIHYDGCGYCGIDGCTTTHDPYYNRNWQPKYYKHDNDDDHYYKNRKRKKRYHDDDDDDDRDDD